jgi:hypothetical protein
MRKWLGPVVNEDNEAVAGPGSPTSEFRRSPPLGRDTEARCVATDSAVSRESLGSGVSSSITWVGRVQFSPSKRLGAQRCELNFVAVPSCASAVSLCITQVTGRRCVTRIDSEA